MALSSEALKSALHAALMRTFSNAGITISLTKAEFRAPIDALDSFFEANAAAINTAIPQPARAQAQHSSEGALRDGRAHHSLHDRRPRGARNLERSRVEGARSTRRLGDGNFTFQLPSVWR